MVNKTLTLVCSAQKFLFLHLPRMLTACPVQIDGALPVSVKGNESRDPSSAVDTSFCHSQLHISMLLSETDFTCSSTQIHLIRWFIIPSLTFVISTL